MNRLRLLAIVPLTLAIIGCGDSPNKEDSTAAKGISYVVTIPPLEAILEEVVGDRGTVTSLLRPGASPHTFEPLPSDAMKVSRAKALFFVSDDFDGWAKALQPTQTVEVFDLLPEKFQRTTSFSCTEDHDHDHHHGTGDDPHFWLDPLTVAAVLPPLTEKLSLLDPEGRQTYESNATQFLEELQQLDAELSDQLSVAKGKTAITAHPSFQYLFERYGILGVGVMEESVGRSATPVRMDQLSKEAKNQSVRAVFTEPQIPRSSALLLSDALGAQLYELDPIGGVEGRESYGDLLRFNAGVLSKAYAE